MEFIKNTSDTTVVIIGSSCTNACGGNCTGQSDSYAKQIGSSKKS